MNRRDFLLATAAVPVLAACGDDKKKPGAQPSPTGPVALQDIGRDAARGLEIADAEAELLQGSSRYAFGLIGPDGPLGGAKATVHVGPDPTRPPTAIVPAVELTEAGLADRGLYVAQVPFPKAGRYYVAILADSDKGQLVGGLQLEVTATSKSPKPGDKAPSVKTPTTKNALTAKPLCSRKPKPCSMHALSLDEALKNGKPTVVVFAAPAFCQTELCGPDVDIVEALAKKHGSKANFIHVEAFVNPSDPKKSTLAPPLKAFKFETEPWLYVIDKKGVVSDRISGAFATTEVRQRLAKVGIG